MLTVFASDQHVTFNAPKAAIATLFHNLPAGGLWFVQFWASVAQATAGYVVTGDRLQLFLTELAPGFPYKVTALQISGGAIADGVWWADAFIYSPGLLNIEFKSQGQATGSGELRSFSGRTTVNKAPVSRTVFAVGVDGDEPVFLARTQSDNNGLYTLEWRGYAGQVVITAVDDYGVPFNSGDARGTGERVHPPAPNGYVYQVASPGQLGAEPLWPAEAGAQVVSGSCVLVALPYYRPKSAGPVVVG